MVPQPLSILDLGQPCRQMIRGIPSKSVECTPIFDFGRNNISAIDCLHPHLFVREYMIVLVWIVRNMSKIRGLKQRPCPQSSLGRIDGHHGGDGWENSDVITFALKPT